MKQFKAGDKVYCPTHSIKVLTVQDNQWTNFKYCVFINQGLISFDEHGLNTLKNGDSSSGTYANPIIFHATEENHALLENLYGVKFEKPKAKPLPRDIMQAMFEYGYRFILYRANGKLKVLKHSVTLYKDFYSDYAYINAEVLDPKTGKIVIDFNPKTGEMILDE